MRQQEGIAAGALEFTILTAARTSETVGARRSEFNVRDKLWTVPAERMKAGKEHRLSLSGRSLELFAAGDDFFFSGGRPGQPLSNMAMLKLLGRTGRDDLTVHGFRSTFRDWASEPDDCSFDVSATWSGAAMCLDCRYDRCGTNGKPKPLCPP